MRGRAKFAVINPDDSIAQEYPWRGNLILDQGLNNMETVLIADLFKYCAAGTGTTVTTRAGTGNISMSIGDATITSTLATFEAGDVGRVVRWTSGADSGYTAKIVAFTDTTHVEAEVAAAANVAAGTHDFHYVNQTGLTTESKRTGDYSTSSGENGTDITSNVVTLTRTYVFEPEEANITYNEIGFSDIATAGTNLNIRLDVSGAPIAVLENQRLKVTYELTVTVTPDTNQSGTVTVTGAMPGSKAASWVIEKVAISLVGINGETDGNSAELEPSVFGFCAFSSDTTALTALTGAVQLSSNVSYVELDPEDDYVAGAFTWTYVGIFDLEDSNRTDLRSLAIYDPENRYSIFRILFNNAQTKDSDHSFTVRYRKTWGRELS
jgi:hypothetical protein